MCRACRGGYPVVLAGFVIWYEEVAIFGRSEVVKSPFLCVRCMAGLLDHGFCHRRSDFVVANIVCDIPVANVPMAA